MYEEADHPHQAAIHLMKSLKCCKECSDSTEVDIREIRELEYRKEMLAEELKALHYKGDSFHHLRLEIQ